MPPQYPNIPRSARAPEVVATEAPALRINRPEAGLRGGGDESNGQGRFMSHEQLVREYANKECSLYAPTKQSEKTDLVFDVYL